MLCTETVRSVAGNGNGHHSLPRTGYGDEAEEPVKPKGRKSKPQPASLSMFEWALRDV